MSAMLYRSALRQLQIIIAQVRLLITENKMLRINDEQHGRYDKKNINCKTILAM